MENKRKMKIEKIMGYNVQRKKVKNINLRINQNMDIYISAPFNLHKDYIEKFICSKEKWIKKVLEKLEEHKNKKKELVYGTGEIHRLLGKEYVLIVKNATSNTVNLHREKNEIILYTNYKNIEDRKKIMDIWYFQCAKRIFSDVMEKWLKILNENIEHLSIKPMKTRWGSCNYNKRYINLNTELIKRTPFEIEYVVLHELAHLKYPNHGKSFYNYMERYMPNYRTAEKMLNAKHYY